MSDTHSRCYLLQDQTSSLNCEDHYRMYRAEFGNIDCDDVSRINYVSRVLLSKSHLLRYVAYLFYIAFVCMSSTVLQLSRQLNFKSYHRIYIRNWHWYPSPMSVRMKHVCSRGYWSDLQCWTSSCQLRSLEEIQLGHQPWWKHGSIGENAHHMQCGQFFDCSSFLLFIFH